MHVLVANKKEEERVIKDWILQTSRFSLSQQKIAKENYFHAAVLFRGYVLSKLKMNEYYCLHSCPRRTHTETLCY